MNSVAVELSEEQADRIAAIARHKDTSPADVVREAVTTYLDKDAEYLAFVQEGIDSADRGELTEFSVVAERLRARLAVRLAEQEP